MKKALFLILSALGTTFFISQPVFAVSYGDDYYVKSNGLTVNGYWTDSVSHVKTACDTTDISTSYVGILAQASQANSTVNGFYSSFSTAVANGGIWAVSVQQINQGDGITTDQVIVAWSEDPNTVPVQFFSNSGVIATPLTNMNNSWKMLTIQGKNGNQSDHKCGEYTVFGENLGASQWAIFSTSPTDFVSNGTFLNAKNYFINAPITYPANYEGEIIPQSGIVNYSNNAISPEWRYAVSNYELEVQSLISDEKLTEFTIDTCLFQIPNNTYGDNFNEYVYDCNQRPPITHTFTEYGTYNIIHRIKTVNGQWFDSSRVLTIDGSSYNGIVGNSATNNTLLSALGNISTESHGLSNIVTAPLAFIADLPSMVNACSSITLPFGNFGNITLPCMTLIYEQRFGTMFTIWQTVLVGLFCYRMGLSLFRKIKNITSPNDDRIEVVNL